MSKLNEALEISEDNYEGVLDDLAADVKLAEVAATKSNRRARRVHNKQMKQGTGRYRVIDGKRKRVTVFPMVGE